jgi:hypothetical protein
VDSRHLLKFFWPSLLVACTFSMVAPVLAEDDEPKMIPAPDRQDGEGEGAKDRSKD